MSANELVGIELNLKGYDGVMADMRALDQMLNGFRGRKNKIQIETDLSNAKKEIIALEGELNKLNHVKLNLDEQGKSSEGLNNKIKETRERLRDARQAVKEFQYALKNLSSMSFQQVFNKISSAVAHLGSVMQSAGNALTRLTNPFKQFTSGMVMGAGYKMLNKFTEGLESGFSRSDTMRKYTRLMKEYETANYSAEQSRKDLDESVTGLPIALDEAVGLAQRYTLSLGDMERGTKLAIATNNAFLASMATETQRYQGMMQMQDLLNGKDLNSREWMSLGASMGKAINEIGKEFGYTNENMGEFRQELYAGNIATEDFLNALEKVGTGNGSLVELAKQSMDTWEAFFSRIGTAASRMVYGILTSMDELVSTASGGKFTSLNALFDDYLIGNIDKMTESIKGWIKAHPEEIIEFGKSLKSIKWGSIISGVGQAFRDVAKFISSIADMFGGKDLSFIGRFMVKGNILGNALTILGGLLKGSRHLIGGIGAGGYKLFKGIKGVKKYGWGGWLARVFTVGEDAEAGKEAVDTATKTVPKMGKFMGGLSKVFTGWAEIATMVGGTALVGFGTFKAFKSMFKDLKEIVALTKEIDWEVASADLIAMGGFITAFIAVGTKVGSGLGLAGLKGGAIFAGLTALFAGTFWADMAMIKRGFKAISDAVGYMKKTVDNLNELASVNNVGEVKAKIKKTVALFNQITDLLQIDRNNPVTGEGTNGLKNLDKKSANTIKNVASAIKSMKEAVNDVNELSGIKLNVGTFGSLSTGFGNILKRFDRMLQDMPSMFKDGTASSWASKMSGTMGNFKSTFASLTGENGILTLMPRIVQEVASLDQGRILAQLPGKMRKLGDALTEVYTSLQGIGAGSYFASNIDSFRAGLKSLKFAIKHLQEISGMEIGGDIVGKIQGIIDNIKSAFDQAKIAEINAAVTTFAIAVKVAFTTLEMLNGDVEIDVNVKLSQNFYNSKNKVIKEIEKAKKDIKSHCKPVKGTIRVSLVFSVISNVGAALAKITRDRQAVERRVAGASRPITPHISTGGQISRNGVLYRSGGGSVFKPRGTDKIPAMLTEGEYVHKKQAVDFFGVDFMRKVNNLDVKGAMQSLLTKAGTSVGVGRQSIVNNTVNNNQRITQNINTNNPNFAGARMGRFVGAL